MKGFTSFIFIFIPYYNILIINSNCWHTHFLLVSFVLQRQQEIFFPEMNKVFLLLIYYSFEWTNGPLKDFPLTS